MKERVNENILPFNLDVDSNMENFRSMWTAKREIGQTVSDEMKKLTELNKELETLLNEKSELKVKMKHYAMLKEYKCFKKLENEEKSQQFLRCEMNLQVLTLFLWIFNFSETLKFSSPIIAKVPNDLKKSLAMSMPEKQQQKKNWNWSGIAIWISRKTMQNNFLRLSINFARKSIHT